MFDRIGEVKVGFEGAYFGPGRYSVKITGVRCFKNRKSLDRIAIECIILESSDPSAHPVGSSASQLLALEHDGTLRDLKSFILAAFPELREDEVVPAVCRWVTDDPTSGAIDAEVWGGLPEAVRTLIRAGTYSQVQPCMGIRRTIVASVKETKSGGMFTKHAWSSSMAAPVAVAVKPATPPAFVPPATPPGFVSPPPPPAYNPPF